MATFGDSRTKTQLAEVLECVGATAVLAFDAKPFLDAFMVGDWQNVPSPTFSTIGDALARLHPALPPAILEAFGAGQSLMTIVPHDASIEIEAMILNQDIGFVEPGQEVVIKVEAFPFTRYGTVERETRSTAKS